MKSKIIFLLLFIVSSLFSQTRLTVKSGVDVKNSKVSNFIVLIPAPYSTTQIGDSLIPVDKLYFVHGEFSYAMMDSVVGRFIRVDSIIADTLRGDKIFANLELNNILQEFTILLPSKNSISEIGSMGNPVDIIYTDSLYVNRSNINISGNNGENNISYHLTEPIYYETSAPEFTSATDSMRISGSMVYRLSGVRHNPAEIISNKSGVLVFRHDDLGNFSEFKWKYIWHHLERGLPFYGQLIPEA